MVELLCQWYKNETKKDTRPMTGPELRRRRRALDLSQTEFALALGYHGHPNTIYRKEAGDRKITQQDQRLLEALERKSPQR